MIWYKLGLTIYNLEFFIKEGFTMNLKPSNYWIAVIGGTAAGTTTFLIVSHLGWVDNPASIIVATAVTSSSLAKNLGSN